MNKKVVFFAFQFATTLYFGQQVQGIVVDAETQSPLSGVKIAIENTGIWTTTDAVGRFEIKYNPNETIVFSRAGLLIERQTFTTSPSQPIKVTMNIASIRIKEVQLSSRKKHYSEIEIREEALKNIQAFSLNEVLEQIPGQKLQNLSLNEFKPIVFRSVEPPSIFNDGFGNKSFGTSIVIDDIPVSNNENMQTYATNGAGGVFASNYIGFGAPESSTRNGYFSNANFGTDLREIPVENIESVEVVQGIPSAKYGDLTSGLVKVNKKSGKTPYRMYVALREGTQEYNFNKGFKVTDRLGYININVNYLQSNSEPRTKFNVYERINTDVMWSIENKKKTLTNSVSFTFGSNIDNANYEAEDIEERLVKNTKRDFSISNRLNWKVKSQLIDNLTVNANFTQGFQNSYDSKLINIGGEIVGTSITEGVYTGQYTPVAYRYIKEVEGKPISMFVSAEIKKNYKSSASWIHNVVLGTSFRGSDNTGRGRLGQPETIANFFTGGGTAFRPYNFADNVRAEYQYSVYAEDNIFKRIGSSILNINAGLRYDNQVNHSTLQPRINAYVIHKKFKFRGGFGIATKAPSINMMYTGFRYNDIVLADLRLPGYYNVGVVQTFIDYADNLNLKPSKSNRAEVGLDFKFSDGYVGLTAFRNVLKDGFTNQLYAIKKDRALLDIQYNGTEAPTYTIAGYTDLYYTSSKLINNLESADQGLELMAGFKKLPVKNFSLDINGSYVETVNNSNTDTLYRSKVADADEVYGLYQSQDRNYRQLMVGGTLNYHLPTAGLIISLRSQHFIINDLDFYDPQKPYAYLDKELNTVYLTQEQIDDPTQFSNIKYTNVSEDKRKLDKVYHNLNLKIAKDFKNGFKFSFYANNFLDLKQTERVSENGQEIKRLKSDLLTLSFGAKLEYEF